MRRLRRRYGRARGVLTSERAQAVRARLMKPLPPEGAHVVGPWGWGLSAARADAVMRKWRKLLSIPGLTTDEIAHKMFAWSGHR